MVRTQGVSKWLGVDLISGGLMHEDLQATMTNVLLIISILNLLSRRRHFSLFNLIGM